MHEFWTGLGDARGYVIGAAVTFLGVLLNVLALWGLEAFRVRKQTAQAQAAWDRERKARLEELRRETYVQVVAACESRAFMHTIPTEEHAEVLSRWRAARAQVRFVTDDRSLIEATDALVTASKKRNEDSAGFRGARTTFVTLCRAELGRANLDITTAPS